MSIYKNNFIYLIQLLHTVAKHGQASSIVYAGKEMHQDQKLVSKQTIIIYLTTCRSFLIKLRQNSFKQFAGNMSPSNDI